MEKDKIQPQEQYTGEQVLEIVRETLFQIERDLADEKFDLKNRKEEPTTSKLEKAALDREISQVNQNNDLVQSYRSKTEYRFLTLCCGAPVKRYALNTRGQCSECGEDNPEAYEKTYYVEDFIKFLNNKIEEENQFLNEKIG